MKYYVLVHSCMERDEFPTCSCSFLDVAPKGLSFSLGAPLPVELPIPVDYRMDKDLPLDDYPFTNMFQFLISSRLRDVVEKHSSVARFYPSRVLVAGRLRSDDYSTVNFERSFKALDWERAEFEEDNEFEGRALSIQRLVIDSAKLPAGEGILRLYEETGIVIASEDFRKDALAAKTTGLKFIDFESEIFSFPGAHC